MYQPTTPPQDPKSLPQWLMAEHNRMAQAINACWAPVEMLYEPPKRLQENMVVTARSPWNPGSGDGAYQLRGGVWRFLG